MQLVTWHLISRLLHPIDLFKDDASNQSLFLFSLVHGVLSLCLRDGVLTLGHMTPSSMLQAEHRHIARTEKTRAQEDVPRRPTSPSRTPPTTQ
jgi:hypothetical protein